ncbi:MAG: hypothetical protein ACRD1R_11075 [Acidobacteriota bacterium]
MTNEQVMKKPLARCGAEPDLDGKRLEKMSFRLSPDHKLALILEASRRSISPSKLVAKITRRYLVMQRLSRGHRHPLTSEVEALHQQTIEMLADGIVDPIERQRWTEIATKAFYRVWNRQEVRAS